MNLSQSQDVLAKRSTDEIYLAFLLFYILGLKMQLFGVAFLLYYLKLSDGSGFWKNHNLIYNPAKFQNEKPNIFGDNDPFVPTNSTLLIFEIRG